MDENEIKAVFKNKIKYATLSFIASALGVILIIGGTVYGFISGNSVIQILGVIFFVGGIIANSLVLRCPSCNKPLPRRQPLRYINYCSNCNTKLK